MYLIVVEFVSIPNDAEVVLAFVGLCLDHETDTLQLD